ncbi:response regulator [Candidatus Symbiobacter mobilis]|nr:response regulator [Candidatus Symbiobacter mobilis]
MADSPAVLVVDDDDFTAQMTAMVLDAAGFAAVTAEGGIDALDVVAQYPSIGVVVSDFEMPFLDGPGLYAELREQGYQQPFVLLTGKDPAALSVLPPGISAVLTKDERLSEDLPALVGELLRGALGHS